MITTIIVPFDYKEFQCIDTACTDSCCAGWQVDVDDYSFAYYKGIEGKFGEKLRSVMVEIPGEEGQFRLCENGDCPFLREDKLCEMFAEIGEAGLCDTCTNYPRFIEDYGEVREMGIAFSCPEAARLMLSKKEPMEYVQISIAPTKSFCPEVSSIQERSVSFKNAAFLPMHRNTPDGYDLKQEEWTKVAQDVLWRTRFMGAEETGQLTENGEAGQQEYIIHSEESFDEDYFQMLKDCRSVAFYIVQNRELKVTQRVLLYLDYARAVQELLDHEPICEESDEQSRNRLKEGMKECNKQYLTTGFLKERVKQLVQEMEQTPEDDRGYDLYGEPVAKGELSYHLMPEYMAVLYQELKHCKPQWGPMLEEAEQLLHTQMDAQTYDALYQEFQEYYQSKEYEYEHLLSYFVFKYFLKAYFDDDIYGKAKVGVMGYLVVTELAVCQWLKQGKTYTTEDQAELFHLYSREMEHSEENYDAFYEALQTEDFCNWEHLKLLLCERL